MTDCFLEGGCQAGEAAEACPRSCCLLGSAATRRCCRRRDLTPESLLPAAELSIGATDFPAQSAPSVTATQLDAWSLGVVLHSWGWVPALHGTGLLGAAAADPEWATPCSHFIPLLR